MLATRTRPDTGLGPLQRPLRELCCVNPECSDKGELDSGNLSVRTGKGSGIWRILRCSTCGEEFSERRGTALFNVRIAPDRILAVAEHLKEGCGIRKTSRLTGVSKDGVTNIAVRLGLHAKALHDAKVRGIDVHGPSSTRSGPSSARSRSAATRPVLLTPTRVTSGTIRPSMWTAAWSCRWSLANAAVKRQRRW